MVFGPGFNLSEEEVRKAVMRVMGVGTYATTGDTDAQEVGVGRARLGVNPACKVTEHVCHVARVRAPHNQLQRIRINNRSSIQKE